MPGSPTGSECREIPPTNAVLAEGHRRLIDDPTGFYGVAVIGVDEHVWRHTRRGDKYVTVIIDLTPIRDKTGPARLLDMVEGRSTQAFQQWLAARPAAWRDGIEVVAMDGFTGFKTAATAELPEAAAVMDPECPSQLEAARHRLRPSTLFIATELSGHPVSWDPGSSQY